MGDEEPPDLPVAVESAYKVLEDVDSIIKNYWTDDKLIVNGLALEQASDKLEQAKTTLQTAPINQRDQCYRSCLSNIQEDSRLVSGLLAQRNFVLTQNALHSSSQ